MGRPGWTVLIRRYFRRKGKRWGWYVWNWSDWFFSGNAFKTSGQLRVLGDARVMYRFYYKAPGSEYGFESKFYVDTSKLLIGICGRKVLIWF
jgi:hypothetical protein